VLVANYGIDLKSVGFVGGISVAAIATCYGAHVNIHLRDQVKFVNVRGRMRDGRTRQSCTGERTERVQFAGDCAEWWGGAIVLATP
jgi:hypothetical protein